MVKKYKTQFGYLEEKQFLDIMEKKFFWAFRKYYFFEKNSKVYVEFGEDSRSKFAEIILNKFQQRYPFEIVKENYDYIIKLDYLEDIIISFFEHLFFNKKPKCIKENNVVRPFFIYSLRDVELYLKIKKIKFKSFLEKYDKVEKDILNFLDNIMKTKNYNYIPTLMASIKICPIVNL